MRQPRTTIALFASMAFVAVMMGLLAGRACHTPKPRAPAVAHAPVIVDAPRAVDPHAPLTQIPAPVDTAETADAGEALPLVAIEERKVRPPRGDAPPAPVAEDPPPPPPPRPPPPPPKPPQPVSVDAGTVVFDAGSTQRSAPTSPPADALPSAPLVVMYRDDLSWLKIIEMRVFLNGKRVVDEKPTDANRPPRGERKLFETRLFPGHHQVRIETVYMGEDSGIFDYMSSVRVRMREMIVVEVDATKGARVNAHAFDRGALEPWEKRPGLKLSQGH